MPDQLEVIAEWFLYGIICVVDALINWEWLPAIVIVLVALTVLVVGVIATVDPKIEKRPVLAKKSGPRKCSFLDWYAYQMGDRQNPEIRDPYEVEKRWFPPERNK